MGWEAGEELVQINLTISFTSKHTYCDFVTAFIKTPFIDPASLV
jgi:hypothetical protein